MIFFEQKKENLKKLTNNTYDRKGETINEEKIFNIFYIFNYHE